ncbi:MAG: outer membrane protein assembly factor BamC [Methylococcaceae bacterium]|nr:outer membrane protein assembly factor BamC [Methylococcaceae bacterium]
MPRKLIYSLPCVLLAACADTSDKYRDIQHLEMPPTLIIEHTASAPTETSDTPTETISGKATKKKSILEGIEQLAEKDGKPILQINTRLDRAWDLTETALKLADIEILDKNRNDLSFQVNYDPDARGLLNFFSNQYDAANYALSLKEATSGIEVSAKLAQKTANGETQESAHDASDELIKRLHQVLQEKVINRDNSGS